MKTERMPSAITSKKYSHGLPSEPTSSEHGTPFCQFEPCSCWRLTGIHFTRDTVSSVGFLQGARLPETANGMKHVCAFRHALALDERRVKFLPEYANGGSAPEGENVKEVWFAGSHSDMCVCSYPLSLRKAEKTQI